MDCFRAKQSGAPVCSIILSVCFQLLRLPKRGNYITALQQRYISNLQLYLQCSEPEMYIRGPKGLAGYMLPVQVPVCLERHSLCGCRHLSRQRSQKWSHHLRWQAHWAVHKTRQADHTHPAYVTTWRDDVTGIFPESLVTCTVGSQNAKHRLVSLFDIYE